MQGESQSLARCARWLERAGRAGFALLLAALWVGLLTAEAGRFAPWLALAAGLAVGVLVWHRAGAAAAEPLQASAGSWPLPAVLLLALASLALTLPPGEWIMGGWDPGVYCHTAGALARQGSLQVECADLAALSASDRNLIGREEQGTWAPFPGMRMTPDGRLSPQFFHLYPVLMALAWTFGGVRAALLVNPLLNVVSIMALFLWARRWVRPAWALAAALALALNPAQVWQARFGTSELLLQVLLLGGLVLLGRRGSGAPAYPWRDAVLAGAALGLALLARYDAVLFVLPLALVLLTALRNKVDRGPLLVVLGMIGLLGAHAWLHQHFLAPFYHPMSTWVVQGLLVTGLAGVVILGLALRGARGESSAAPALPHRWLPLVAAAAFIGWAFFFWYIRPRLGVDGLVLKTCTWLYPGLTKADWFPLLAGTHARNFWYLEALFGRAGLLIALAGVLVLILRARSVWQTAWLAGALGTLALLMLFIFHEPFMMFAARRLVPVVLPLLAVGVAAAGDALWPSLRSRPKVGGLAAALLLALTLVPTLGGTLFMAHHRDWPGLVAWYERLVAQLPAGARVFSDQPGFAAPLRFIHGVRAVELLTTPATQNQAMDFLVRQARAGETLWLTQFPIPAAYTNRFLHCGGLPLDSSILGSERHQVPRYIRGRDGPFKLYRVRPDAPSGT